MKGNILRRANQLVESGRRCFLTGLLDRHLSWIVGGRTPTAYVISPYTELQASPSSIHSCLQLQCDQILQNNRSVSIYVWKSDAISPHRYAAVVSFKRWNNVSGTQKPTKVYPFHIATIMMIRGCFTGRSYHREIVDRSLQFPAPRSRRGPRKVFCGMTAQLLNRCKTVVAKD